MGMFNEARPLGSWYGGKYTPYASGGTPMIGPYWTMPYKCQPESTLQIPAHNLKIDLNGLQTWCRAAFPFGGKTPGQVFQPFASWGGTGIFSLPLIGSSPTSATWLLQILPTGATYYVQIEVYYYQLSRISASYLFSRYNLRVSSGTFYYFWYGSKIDVETAGPLGTYRLYTWPISMFTNPIIAGGWNALPVNGFAPVELTVTEDV